MARYIFSPGLGGYLSTIIGMLGVFFLAFLFYAAATGVLFFTQSQKVERKLESRIEPTSSKSSHAEKIVLLSMFFAAVFFFLSLVRPFVVQFFQDVYGLESFLIGVLGSICFLGSALFSIVLGRVGDKFGKMVAATIALLIGSFSFGLFICFNNFVALAFASLLNGASYMLWALMGASVGSITPEESRGRWISVSQMLAAATASIAPFIGGVIYESSPYTLFYIIIGVLPMLSVVALTLFKEEAHFTQTVTKQ